MILYFNKQNVPRPFSNRIRNLPHTNNDVILVTTLSEPENHVIALHKWLSEHEPNYQSYKGNMMTISIISQEITTLLKLSLPLS